MKFEDETHYLLGCYNGLVEVSGDDVYVHSLNQYDSYYATISLIHYLNSTHVILEEDYDLIVYDLAARKITKAIAGYRRGQFTAIWKISQNTLVVKNVQRDLYIIHKFQLFALKEDSDYNYS
jgi:hypothetical protein